MYTFNCINVKATIAGVDLRCLREETKPSSRSLKQGVWGHTPEDQQLVYGSHCIYLDNTLLGGQVTAGLGFLLHSSHLVHNEDSEDCDSLLYRPQPS